MLTDILNSFRVDDCCVTIKASGSFTWKSAPCVTVTPSDMTWRLPCHGILNWHTQRFRNWKWWEEHNKYLTDLSDLGYYCCLWECVQCWIWRSTEIYWKTCVWLYSLCICVLLPAPTNCHINRFVHQCIGTGSFSLLLNVAATVGGRKLGFLIRNPSQLWPTFTQVILPKKQLAEQPDL